ncbi:Calcium-dependent protein kinase 4, partial [Durusdinium trenchii]
MGHGKNSCSYFKPWTVHGSTWSVSAPSQLKSMAFTTATINQKVMQQTQAFTFVKTVRALAEDWPIGLKNRPRRLGRETDGRDARESRKRIPEVWIAHVMQQVLSAITHIHANGIIHLDIKSQNIMLMPALETKAQFLQADLLSSVDLYFHTLRIPHVMVIDLGVATIFQPGNFKRGNPMGTPATMAPEVWRGEITPKADVFSCGCVLFEMLSFQMPWDFKYRPTPGTTSECDSSKQCSAKERILHAPSDATAMVLKMLEQ